MKKLVKVSVFRDGGTSMWMEPQVRDNIKTIEDVDNAQSYYLDGRIGSQTQGELFDRYPKDENAIMLDKSEFEFLESR